MKRGLPVRLGAAEATFSVSIVLTVSESNVRNWHARRGKLGETRPANTFGRCEGDVFSFYSILLTVSERNVRHWHARRGRLRETRPASAFGRCGGHVFGLQVLFF